MPRLRNATACLRAADKAFGWLQSRLENENEWRDDAAQPLTAYHKAPQLFLLTGHLEASRTALKWVKDNLLTSEGKLLRRPAAENVAPEYADTREMAWIALSAHGSGRYEISFPLAKTLLGFQGRNTGGVYEADPSGGCAAEADVRATACAGLAYLACGYVEEARLAGEFLARAALQNADSDKFHVRLDTNGRPVTRFPKEDSDRYVIAKARGKGLLSYLGVPMIFLTRLHLATDEREWVETAADFFTIAERYGEKGWASQDVGTVAWGAATLYDITRRRFYYDAAETITAAVKAKLRTDGSYRAGKDADEGLVISLTAEAALCLIETIREAQ